MKTVKSFSYKEYGVIMVQDGEYYRVISTNSKSLETGSKTTFSKASETFDKFVESVLAEDKEIEYAPV